MGRNKKYGNIILKDSDREILEKIARSQTEEYCKVQRAKIILYSAEGMSNTEIARTIFFQLGLYFRPLGRTPHENCRSCLWHADCANI